MADAFIGEIRIIGFNFAPKNWAACSGQLIQIQQNTALYSILGTTFGGNGSTTFGLPNLQGRAPMAAGSGQGLTPRVPGEVTGFETVTVTNAQLPAHTHPLVGQDLPADRKDPAGAYPARGAKAVGPSLRPVNAYQTLAPADVMAASAVGPAGGSLAHANLQPYLAMNFCICQYGLYPIRS
ncbi:MAG: phage tail protein [Acidobacteria bacterium]|nr:phage tail protein [Acidobacteriota bacterium]